MRPRIVVPALVVMGVFALAASSRAQAPALPQSVGSEVASTKCLGCHGADLIVSQRLAQGGWDREITKMERWGARLTAEERAALLGYVAREFGLRPAASHDPQLVAAGEAVHTAACRTCHDTGFVEQQRLDTAAWGREVDKMVRWGAKVAAADKPALVAFLTSRWGRN